MNPTEPLRPAIPGGRIMLVGLGPGAHEHLTARARRRECVDARLARAVEHHERACDRVQIAAVGNEPDVADALSALVDAAQHGTAA